jgi:hypothetical protein
MAAAAAAAAPLAEAEVRREMMSEAGGGLLIPSAKRFDSNIITPVSCLLMLCSFISLAMSLGT